MPSLTSHLLQLDKQGLHQATTHPFLTAAATSSLPTGQLKQWLAQDRLYAMSYTNFMGELLAKCRIPTSADRESTLSWRAVDLLIDCLTNIRNEIHLFEKHAADENWLQDICSAAATVPERPTRCYQDLFAGATAQGRPLLVGLTVLWATEECYLRAWRFARDRMDEHARSSSSDLKSGDVMQRVFIPNWSSDEFETFVRRIGGLVDEMCAQDGVEEGGWVWRECEAAWRQVIWIEHEFWPKVD